MAKRRAVRGRAGSGGAGAGRLVGGFVVGAAVAVGGVYLYQHTPGTAGTRPALSEPVWKPTARAIAPAPRPAPGAAVKVAPFGTSEEVFEAGARAYADRCAGCHGSPGRRGAATGRGAAAQFWDRRHEGTERPAGEIYESIAAGAPGMPAYRSEMTEAEMWDVALLLQSARGDLPDPVLRLLRGGR